MIETHNNPKIALSDIEQQITPNKLEKIINKLILRDPKLRDKSFEKELMFLRDQIDVLDKEIVLLLNNRKQIVEKIANFKQKNQLTIFQIERWMEILKTRKKDANKIGLDSKMIVEIFELIHKYSILTQTRIIRN
tara:strand:- start:332 stop:736 length:405 start_codon:yes stop_codon:yes gene_type:complete